MDAFWLLYSARVIAPNSSSSWSCLSWVINWPRSWTCLPGDTPTHAVAVEEPTDADGEWVPESGFRALTVPSAMLLRASTTSERDFSFLYLLPPNIGHINQGQNFGTTQIQTKCGMYSTLWTYAFDLPTMHIFSVISTGATLGILSWM